ncbi:SDR family NAD(P)-dependent oxidoreductase [Pseudonocardia sp. CA-142604]|uniref:SDR family NAD(P)-dependent oxidoreductase n=1 Tax=Pseudonocardia sp. CA-142604 TaxID=3240024 RepID=UPI003D8D20D8
MSTALITGGNTGLGAAFAQRLAAQGHNLVLVARNRERLEGVAGRIRAEHRVEVEVLSMDLAVPAERAIVERRLNGSVGGPVDILVNNAGVSTHELFDRATPAGLQSEIDVNITAVLQLTRAALPGMLGRGQGIVINVGSFAGYLGNPGSAYSASKAWVMSFTDSIAASLVGTGVQAIAICAGQMRTGRHIRAGRPVGSAKSPLWLEPADVVDRCLSDLRKQRTLSVPGATYRTAVNLLELPRRSLRTVARLAGHGREQQAIRVRAPKEPESPTVILPSVHR